MNRILRKAALISSFAVPAMLGAQVANAALITEWDYEIDSTFSAFTPTAGNGTVDGTGTNAVLGGDTTLSWGTQDDGTPEPAQSSISVTSDVDGGPPALQTNIGSVPGASFTHVNNEIDADSSFLDTFMLTTQLSLTSTQPLGEAGQNELVGPITFNSNFIETENDGTCVAGSTSNCDDIFVLDNAATLAAIGSGQSFNLGGFTYTVFLDVMGLGPLTDAQCTEAGAATGCVGFLTEENATNTFTTEVRITAREISEPGILALLGLGLIGLGALRRSRKV